MSTWTSSLRLKGGVVGAGFCLVAFACPGNGWAAGGTPMPAPDDPPPTYRASTVKTAGSTTTPTSPRANRVVAEAAQPVPAPDAPITAASATASKAPPAKQAALPAPDPSPGAASASSTGSTSTSPRASAGSTVRATRPAARSTFTPPRAAPKPKPKPRPKTQRKTVVTTVKKATAVPVAHPRDAARLGLPVGRLASHAPGGDGMEGGLLVAAALLLAAAAGGSLLLGIAARTATRHA